MTDDLGDYALLGDFHTIALVNSRGGLDWLCVPRFDSMPCFAALTNGDRGGSWTVSPEKGGRVTRRRYRPGTLVLESEWDTPSGTIRTVDCMAPRADDARVVRIVEGITGCVPVHVVFKPRFDHGDRTPWLRCTGTTVSAVAGSDALWLDASVPLVRVAGHNAAEARFTVAAGQQAGFVLTHTASYLPKPPTAAPGDLIGATERFWSKWSAGVDGTDSWGDALQRAMITLKALTHTPTGAVVSSPVFRTGEPPSLCDVAEASSTLRALLHAELADEARAWREWLVRAVAGDPRYAATRYTVDGRGDPSARATGAGSLGELLHGVNSADHLWLPSRDPAWDLQLDLLDHLESAWDQPDDDQDGIGSSPGHRVVSKVRAWAGLDRAVRTADRHGLPGPVDRWRAARARLRAEVCAKGYDPNRNTFTSHYGSDVVDPELLMMPEVGFLPWRDVRVRGTVSAITAALSTADNVMPVSLAPGTPLMTGFRLVAALDGTGESAAAGALFRQLLTARNDVGLLGKFYDPTARHIGLTPNVTSVVSMINAARQLRSRLRTS
ncbi:glycoside hydrolase family 15 protein [Actinophytocola algeriensis]|uniref:GH15 family glucan-1,4-alpha-glucosidase n=1 Tax=Actinophytocola algeriensis TaxID=1768010 RepID=A0A7W7Q3B1_9PSEU|nr:glycoside hydrolase family 15 protein [Actinophytocola algeriensis]MBB4906142.1 GH15 family glucan-1,4-alpha-glucosidase [Actinophytocola algeriensis]MBE1472172.1 GH15 family glucan-1,4-alpha-glucosidase [Actinophytocola algeriensis]